MSGMEEIAKKQPAEVDASVDRREHLRVDYRGRVAIATNGGTFWGRLEDVSVGGVLVGELDGLPAATSVSVGFDLPGKGTVEAKATVLRIANKKVALRFTEIDEASLESIRRWLRRTDEYPQQ